MNYVFKNHDKLFYELIALLKIYIKHDNLNVSIIAEGYLRNLVLNKQSYDLETLKKLKQIYCKTLEDYIAIYNQDSIQNKNLI